MEGNTEERRFVNSRYIVVGILYFILSLPGWALLAAGKLVETRNVYLLISLMGAPLGLLFLAFGTGRLPRNSRSGTGIRVGYIGLAFAFFTLGAVVGVSLGVGKLQTAVQFCAMASSYLALVTLAFLMAAAFSRRT
jgi:hypothetical protein